MRPSGMISDNQNIWQSNIDSQLQLHSGPGSLAAALYLKTLRSLLCSQSALPVLLDIQGTGIGIGYSAAHRVFGNFVAVSCKIKDSAFHEVVASLNPVLR